MSGIMRCGGGGDRRWQGEEVDDDVATSGEGLGGATVFFRYIHFGDGMIL
jgi:hypothetical protein